MQDPDIGITTSYAYDSVGNRCNQTTSGMATCTAPSSSSTTYAWNSYGQMCWSGTGATSDSCSSTPSGATTYTYDGNGLRSSSTSSGSTQQYVWDEAGNTTDPTLLMDGTNAYIYGPENFGAGTAPLEQISLTGNSPLYLASDKLGVRDLFNNSGSLKDGKGYNPYGISVSLGTASTPFGFEGGYTDPSGLVYLLARYYDPLSGQFLSVDPVYSSADPYAYSADDPLNFSDPTGLCWICSVFHSVVHAVSKMGKKAVHFVSKVYHKVSHFVVRHWKTIVKVAIVIVVVAVVTVATGGLGDAVIAAGASAEATGDAAAAIGAASAITTTAGGAGTEAAASAAWERRPKGRSGRDHGYQRRC